jgi:phosphoserine aminotransferase
MDINVTYFSLSGFFHCDEKNKAIINETEILFKEFLGIPKSYNVSFSESSIKLLLAMGY